MEHSSWFLIVGRVDGDRGCIELAGSFDEGQIGALLVRSECAVKAEII